MNYREKAEDIVKGWALGCCLMDQETDQLIAEIVNLQDEACEDIDSRILRISSMNFIDDWSLNSCLTQGESDDLLNRLVEIQQQAFAINRSHDCKEQDDDRCWLSG